MNSIIKINQSLTKEDVKIMQSSQPLSEMHKVAAKICRDYLTGAWKYITPEEIILKRVSGGLSNFLYLVQLPKHLNQNNLLKKLHISSSNEEITGIDCGVGATNNTLIVCNKRQKKSSKYQVNEPKEVLLRIYSQTHGEDAVEKMLTESVVFTLLSERNLGPKLHGIFPGGRIEQYIPARPLITSELSNKILSKKIAEKMAEIHTLVIPVAKQPDWIWNTMERWMKMIDTILQQLNENSLNANDEYYYNKLKAINFRSEILWLKEIIINNNNFPVIFSHNDMQEGNILYKENIRNSVDIVSTGDNKLKNNYSNGNYINHNKNNDINVETEPELMIIDFEYCAYNYRGFDLANHFLEWTFDYRNDKYPYYYHHIDNYPTLQQKIDFLISYSNKYNAIKDLSNNNNNNYNNYQLSNIDQENLLKEIDVFTMASHLFWTLWSIINVHQDIEFGYWHYGHCRITEYFRNKEIYLNNNNTTV